MQERNQDVKFETICAPWMQSRKWHFLISLGSCMIKVKIKCELPAVLHI